MVIGEECYRSYGMVMVRSATVVMGWSSVRSATVVMGWSSVMSAVVPTHSLIKFCW